jgi:hypothetical protein
MFKSGDTVVAIEDCGELVKNNFYTVKTIYWTDNISLVNIMWVYSVRCFMSVSEFRKLKLEKICSLKD